MHGIIEEADWMDQETKAKAAEKLDKITTNIAYPDYIMDPNDTKMDSDYEKVTVDKNAYFDNVQQLTALNEAKGFAKLGKPVDREE